MSQKRDVIFHLNDQVHPFASGKDQHTAPFSGRLFTKDLLFESLELLFYIVTSKYVSVLEFGIDHIKARDVSLAFRHRIGDVLLTTDLFLKAHVLLTEFVSRLSPATAE